MPYISASIFQQIAQAVVPQVDKMSKDEEGRKKINQWSRYATVVLAAVQAWGFAIFAESLPGAVANPGFGFRMSMAFFLTTGAIFVMWLGEQITERGIGNGASLMIFFSIVERIWPGIVESFKFVSTGAVGAFSLRRADHHDGRRSSAAVVAVTMAARRVLIQIPQRTMARGRHARGVAELHSAAHQLVGRHADRVRAVGDRRAGRVRAVHGQPSACATSPTISLRARTLYYILIGDPDPVLHVLLHVDHLQSGRPGGEPEEAGRIHSRREAGREDGRVHRRRRLEDHAAGRAVPDGGRAAADLDRRRR